MNSEIYVYTNSKGQQIHVCIEEDCGMVNGERSKWHKVLCRPIGYNNSPLMTLDKAKLRPEQQGNDI